VKMRIYPPARREDPLKLYFLQAPMHHDWGCSIQGTGPRVLKGTVLSDTNARLVVSDRNGTLGTIRPPDPTTVD